MHVENSGKRASLKFVIRNIGHFLKDLCKKWLVSSCSSYGKLTKSVVEMGVHISNTPLDEEASGTKQRKILTV
eukprot:69098-Amphidinium_carterae.1